MVEKNGSIYGFLISNWTFTGTFFLRKRFRGTANFAVKILTLPDKIASNLYWASLQNSSHFPNIIIYTILSDALNVFFFSRLSHCIKLLRVPSLPWVVFVKCLRLLEVRPLTLNMTPLWVLCFNLLQSTLSHPTFLFFAWMIILIGFFA